MEIRVEIDTKGKRNIANINKLPLASINGIRQSLYVIGKFLTKKAKSNILHTTKSGVYYKYNNRRYRASASGEFPANRSGANRRSIQFKVIGKRKMKYGADMPYSKYLEFGTVNMDHRNFLLRTIKETKGKQKKILYNEMKRFIENVYK